MQKKLLQDTQKLWVSEICYGRQLHEPFNSFIYKTKNIIQILDIDKMKRTPTSSALISPPWQAVNKYVVIPDDEHRIYTHVEFQAYMDDNYQQFQKIYTDGSKITEPNPSVASAIYIPHINRTTCWRMRNEHSILSAELFAILQALKYINNETSGSKWIILTDSMSALRIIAGTSDRYCDTVNEIQQLILNIVSTQEIILHWVKSHVGILGNEIADKSANAGHQNNRTILYSLAREECYSELKRKSLEFWDTYWKQTAELTSRGLFLKNVRENLQQSVPLNVKHRRAEIVIYRLRMGHVGLNDYLHRFNMHASNLCQECRAPETIEHFLLYCQKYDFERANLLQQLRKHNVFDLNVKTLLGGSAQHYNKRRSIYAALSTFYWQRED